MQRPRTSAGATLRQSWSLPSLSSGYGICSRSRTPADRLRDCALMPITDAPYSSEVADMIAKRCAALRRAAASAGDSRCNPRATARPACRCTDGGGRDDDEATGRVLPSSSSPPSVEGSISASVLGASQMVRSAIISRSAKYTGPSWCPSLIGRFSQDPQTQRLPGRRARARAATPLGVTECALPRKPRRAHPPDGTTRAVSFRRVARGDER